VAVQQIATDRTARFADYIEARRFDPPRPLLARAAALAERKAHAFDFGAGALNATKYLLSAGFERITALDAAPKAQELAQQLPREHTSFVLSRFEDFAYPADCYDLVNAEFCLPFLGRDQFSLVFPRLLGALRGGGIFTGQLFGVRDSWNVENSGMTFHQRAEAEAYFADFDIVELAEEDHPGTTKLGEPKHWHIFHIIARKTPVDDRKGPAISA